jgi:hypothetical protein
MKESIADLERRRDLLKEIKELSQWCPDEDNAERAGSFLATLKEIAETDWPDEDYMKEVDDHLAALRQIAEIDSPSEDEMRDVSDHLVTLKTIENRSN